MTSSSRLLLLCLPIYKECPISEAPLDEMSVCSFRRGEGSSLCEEPYACGRQLKVTREDLILNSKLSISKWTVSWFDIQYSRGFHPPPLISVEVFPTVPFSSHSHFSNRPCFFICVGTWMVPRGRFPLERTHRFGQGSLSFCMRSRF